MKKLIPFFILTLLFSCATDRDAYKRTLNLAFEELNEMNEQQTRGIASAADSLSISNLKSTRMLVFPKVYTSNLKRSEENPINYKELKKMGPDQIKGFFQAREDYYSPYEFQINPVKRMKCKKLARTKSYKVFLKGRKLGGENCVVIEVKKVFPKFFGKWVGEIRRDDLLKVRLIMSDSLKPFGKRVYLATELGKKRYRTVDVILDDRESMASGLDFSPIDIPNPQNFKIKKGAKTVEKGLVRIPQDIFLVSNIKMKVKGDLCQNGTRMDYRDDFGNPVNVDWCQGGTWPDVINNSKFFAIKK